MFFGRVVVFVENLLSSQMGVVSAIRRSSRSADRRRKTQETVWAVRRAVYTSSSLSRLVLLLVAGCVEVPPPLECGQSKFWREWGATSHHMGRGRGDHQVAAFSRATLIDRYRAGEDEYTQAVETHYN